MLRFIFVCMGLVALSILTISSQYMLHGIKEARQEVAARNTVNAVEQQPAVASGPTFEEIYASMPQPETASVDMTDPAALNAIETTAGGDEFPATGFTGVAPAGLADEEPAAPAIDNATASEEAAN